MRTISHILLRFSTDPGSWDTWHVQGVGHLMFNFFVPQAWVEEHRSVRQAKDHVGPILARATCVKTVHIHIDKLFGCSLGTKSGGGGISVY